jgi:hypothetical protein
MSAISPATQALCRQCSAPLDVEQGTTLTTCEFCGTTNVLDKSQSVFHYAVRETVRPHEAEAMLKRWMGGNDTVKDLDTKATIERPVFQLFPMWLVRAKQNGQEKVLLEPAAAISVSELKELHVPAASLESYDHSLDNSAIQPTVPYKTMLNWLADEHKITSKHLTEAAIVHLPIYLFKYNFDGNQFTAVVDAATGQVFSNIYPSKWEAPYQAIGGIGCVAYFLAALVPAFMFVNSGGIGIITGLLIYLVISVVLAIPIMAIAAYISAKV